MHRHSFKYHFYETSCINSYPASRGHRKRVLRLPVYAVDVQAHQVFRQGEGAGADDLRQGDVHPALGEENQA